MMELGRFLGMNITFCEDFAADAHVHVQYNQHYCVIGVENLAIFNGSLPPRVAGLAIEWVNLNRQTLIQNWQLYKNGNVNLTPLLPLTE